MMKTFRTFRWSVALVSTVFLSLSAGAQTNTATSPASDAPPAAALSSPAGPPAVYAKPSQKTKFRSYAFEAFGPYPILGAAFAAGINQAENSPPEWKQGGEGYGKRFGSNFGIAAITTTTRYGLAEAFREDTVYYRCECAGFFPRLGHAVISTVTARRGDDGHRVFSVPSLVSPYVGTMTAVYGWYPDRYGAKDALRMGNYNLLGFVGGNIALEFIYGGPHTLFSRIHRGSQ